MPTDLNPTRPPPRRPEPSRRRPRLWAMLPRAVQTQLAQQLACLGSGFGQLFEPVPSAGPHWAEAA